MKLLSLVTLLLLTSCHFYNKSICEQTTNLDELIGQYDTYSLGEDVYASELIKVNGEYFLQASGSEAKEDRAQIQACTVDSNQYLEFVISDGQAKENFYYATNLSYDSKKGYIRLGHFGLAQEDLDAANVISKKDVLGFIIDNSKGNLAKAFGRSDILNETILIKR